MSRDRRVVITPERLQEPELAEDIEALLRRPFRRELARILGCAPTDAAILKFSKRFPDRWGQLVAIFGRLAGYTEKIEVESNLAREINALSDAEVMARLESVEHELERSKAKRELPPHDVMQDTENIDKVHKHAYATGAGTGAGAGGDRGARPGPGVGVRSGAYTGA
jgi:hypothetical protein